MELSKYSHSVLLALRLQSGLIGSCIRSSYLSSISGYWSESTYCKEYVSKIKDERFVPLWRTSQWTDTGLDDEALHAAIEVNSSLMCSEFARRSNVSHETIRLHLYRLSTTYRLSKRVHHTPLGYTKGIEWLTVFVAFLPPYSINIQWSA